MWEDVQPGAVTASGSQGRHARDETMFLVSEQVITSPVIIYLKIRGILTF